GAIELVAFVGVIGLRNGLPLELGGQTHASPACESIRLVIGDMVDRSVRIALLPAGVGELLSVAPIKRRLDRLPPYPVPSVGQPQGSRTIATIGHELFPVAVGNQLGSQGERLQQHAVGGPFVVEGEVLRSEEHTSELQSRENLVCRLL